MKGNSAPMHCEGSKSARIAIVEDDIDQCDSMHEYLEFMGYPVWSVPTANGFYRRQLLEPIDIVVLDIGLPGENGLTLARHVMQTGVGIVIVSARSEVADRVSGLNAGADSYLAKPVELSVLDAHIDALWRRMRCNSSDVKIDDTAWSLCNTHRELFSPAGQAVSLTPSEFALLNNMVKNGSYISRQDIASVLANNPEQFNFHRIDVLLNRLRKKVKQRTGMILPIVSAAAQRLELTSQIIQK